MHLAHAREHAAAGLDAVRSFPDMAGGSNWRRTRFGYTQLTVEIVKSCRSYDLRPKLTLYQRAEVQEYVAALLEETTHRMACSGRGQLSFNAARF